MRRGKSHAARMLFAPRRGTWALRLPSKRLYQPQGTTMKTAPIRTFESDARPNVRLAIVTTVLLIGALLACFSSDIRAAEPFARGNTTGSIYVGAGRALDREYT